MRVKMTAEKVATTTGPRSMDRMRASLKGTCLQVRTAHNRTDCSCGSGVRVVIDLLVVMSDEYTV